MEIDKRQLVDDVATALWASKDPLGLEPPFEEQPKFFQFTLREQVLPLVNIIAPLVEKTVKDSLIDIINRGHDNKQTPEEILLSLTWELSAD